MFAQFMLERQLPSGVDLIKVDVPMDATPQTSWEWTMLSRQPYFVPLKPLRSSWDVPAALGYEMMVDLDLEPHNSDVYTLLRKHLVSVTPLTLDMTARVDKNFLARFANPDNVSNPASL
jgi:5'-nucleotidase